MSRRIGWPASRVGSALVELAAVGRIGEPEASIRVWHHVIGRVESLAVVIVGDDRDRAVELIAGNASCEMLARHLPALEVKGITVAVVRRRAEQAHATVVLEPSQLTIVGNVAPDKITALSVPSRPLRPESASP